jgi:hypothetical protein
MYREPQLNYRGKNRIGREEEKKKRRRQERGGQISLEIP